QLRAQASRLTAPHWGSPYRTWDSSRAIGAGPSGRSGRPAALLADELRHRRPDLIHRGLRVPPVVAVVDEGEGEHFTVDGGDVAADCGDGVRRAGLGVQVAARRGALAVALECAGFAFDRQRGVEHRAPVGVVDVAEQLYHRARSHVIER